MGNKNRIAFLGYDESQTPLIAHLRKQGFEVDQRSDRVEELGEFELVVSFGYRHILRPHVLATARRPVINLHISYLPFNKGAHPNFWSWIENTPSGTTIHEVDEGIDTGATIDRRKLNADPSGLTFRDSYEMLVKQIEMAFVERCSEILTGTYRATPQSEPGTFHRASDLPEWMDTWDMPITDAIARYHYGT